MVGRMRTGILDDLARRTSGLVDDGLFKSERVIASPQSAHITLADGSHVLNLCANNYLGLADHPALVEAAHAALDSYGYGMASVRFICGTQTVHKELEAALSSFLGTDDTILYSSCFDANGGLFETILDEQDCVISDSLNHASIIDGIRLSKAQRMRYDHLDNGNDMAQLEQCLRDAAGARYRLIATDGVFSMDGVIANLSAICDLAERYGAMVMVDDSHAVGFVGATGRGSHEHCDVMGRVDIITGTLGKALGGASGGYTSGRKEVVDWLRQRSRPYLFSNSLAPAITATTLRALTLLQESGELQRQLQRNAERFRAAMQTAGFTLAGSGHPIIPVMLGDAKVASEMAQRLLVEGIYVTAFSFPVVPNGKARIRTQMSAAHSDADIDAAVAAFATVGEQMGVLK